MVWVSCCLRGWGAMETRSRLWPAGRLGTRQRLSSPTCAVRSISVWNVTNRPCLVLSRPRNWIQRTPAPTSTWPQSICTCAITTTPLPLALRRRLWTHRTPALTVYTAISSSGVGGSDAALAHLRQSVALGPSDYEAIGALARLLTRLGQTGEAAELLRRGRELASQDIEYGQACFEAVCGHTTAALVLLAEALDRGQAQVGWARHDPEFEFLRDDPGFEALLSSR